VGELASAVLRRLAVNPCFQWLRLSSEVGSPELAAQSSRGMTSQRITYTRIPGNAAEQIDTAT
jgi:hypothetical protein